MDMLATRQTVLRCQDVANKSATNWQQVVVMEFGKRHDATDTTDFYPRQLVADLLQSCRLCCGLFADLQLGNSSKYSTKYSIKKSLGSTSLVNCERL